MTIEEGKFYKSKEYYRGNKTPGGYFYVAGIEGDRVRWAPTEHPDITELTGVSFTMPLDDFMDLLK